VAINGIYSTTAGASTAPQGRTNNLSVNDFLKLMAAQLQSQSLYDQTDNSEFLAQLAQFTALQQMTELALATKINTAISLLGKKVTVSDYYTGGIKTGTVSSVSMSEGIPYVKVNGEFYPLSDLLEISAY
jgi:flagellar basal-body rod modification protein FlgD